MRLAYLLRSFALASLLTTFACDSKPLMTPASGGRGRNVEIERRRRRKSRERTGACPSRAVRRCRPRYPSRAPARSLASTSRTAAVTAAAASSLRAPREGSSSRASIIPACQCRPAMRVRRPSASSAPTRRATTTRRCRPFMGTAPTPAHAHAPTPARTRTAAAASDRPLARPFTPSRTAATCWRPGSSATTCRRSACANGGVQLSFVMNG